jgi:hypothetical protein
MYGKISMTRLKYQAYLHGSEAIIYLSAFPWVLTVPALHIKRTQVWINYHTFVEKQEENLSGR